MSRSPATGAVALLFLVTDLLAPAGVAAAAPVPAATVVAGRVTIIGDSVTIDARRELRTHIPGAAIYAKLDEQWDQGVDYARHAKAQGRLGATVVVALGTNGPITSEGMARMMRVLSVCTRVVLVTNYVPTWWQNPNNRRLKTAARTRRGVVLADWESLAAVHSAWFYPDGVHMPIGGAGARAFARLIASKV
jgi:hypothetical protein